MKECLKDYTPDEATQAVLNGLEKARLFYASEIPTSVNTATVRIAKPNDAVDLANLYRDAFPGYPFASLVHTKEGHLNFLGDLGQIRMVIIQDKTLVAAAALGTIPPDRSAEIKQVVVHPECQGKGYCPILLEHMVNVAEMSYLQYLYMDVRARMIPMQKAALKAGFSAVGFRAGQHIVYHPEGPRREHMIHVVKYLNGAAEAMDEPDKQNIAWEIINQLAAVGIHPTVIFNALSCKR